MNEKFTDYLETICKEHPELKIDFHYSEWETDFLRFFNSQVNYNISKNARSLGASIYKGKKKYSFSIANPSEKDVREQVNNTLKIIDILPEDPDFVDLENDLTMAEQDTKENNIEKVTLAKKIEILEKVAKAVAPYKFNIYGTFICNYQQDYIINSNKINKSSIGSPIMLELKAVAETNEVTVIESFGSEDISSFNLDRFIEQLILKVKSAAADIIDVKPDSYEVILAPRCIGELISYLVYAGMTASSYDRKISYFENRIDEKIFPENITITDDPKFPGLIGVSYNSEGHIYEKATLIEKGVFKSFLVDNYYSHKTGLKKNGNEAECLVLEKGDKSLTEMIKSVKRGLYISNLHYMNFINPKETSVTGLTRDGTFLIENGELKNVVNNLRFTIKIADVLKNIVEIEDLHHLVPSSDNYGHFSISSFAMPHVKVSAFKISSSTETI